MANIGVVTALVGRDDAVFADRLNHASLNDAALLSRAQFKRWAHDDLAKLLGYGARQALTAGVFWPADGSEILLFVNRESRSDFAQYANEFDGEILTMDGRKQVPETCLFYRCSPCLRFGIPHIRRLCGHDADLLVFAGHH